MATSINYCPPPCSPVLRRCRVPDWWGRISVDYPALGRGDSPVSDQSKINLGRCAVRLDRCKLSSSSLVWDVEKVLMEDQTVQLLYQGVKVREGDTDERVEKEISEMNGREQVFGLQEKKLAYLCPKCKQAFKLKTLFKDHLLSHYYTVFFKVLPNSKPFPCPICGKLNRDKISLARHYAFTHKKFFDLTELTHEDLTLPGHGKGSWPKKHLHKMILKNSPEERYSGMKICKQQDGCEERCKETSNLEEDYEEVLDVGLSVEAKKNTKKGHFYECFKCGQSKETVGYMRRHILSHYQQVFSDVLPNKKPFNCPICDMCFNQRGSLVRHFAFSHEKIFELTDLTPEDLFYSRRHVKKKMLEQKHCEIDEKSMTVLSSSLLNASEGTSAEEAMEVEDSHETTYNATV